ncbi:MAG: hypothetical protein ACFHWZ_03420 [Phycisphaerales bacterium]
MSSRITEKVHFKTGRSGQKKLEAGAAPEKPVDEGRVPRVARLLALAIRCEKLIADGHIADQAELARLGHVTRARMSQIMNLTLLAPDIQEEILFLPRVLKGCDPVSEQKLRPVVREVSWAKQRVMWRRMRGDG